jgi:hypothetical protein
MIDSRGVPRTWRHFQYGLRVMGRLDARSAIRMASAASVPQMKDAAKEEWYRRQESAAGW